MMQLMKMGPCGGAGGSEKDMDMTSVTRIVKIAVRSGGAIDAVSFLLYEHRDRGDLEWSPQWGGCGGSFNEINLAANEYLTNVMGHYGYFNKYLVVRSLTFVTNLHVYGPYGCQEGVAFALPLARGKIIGFHGRSGQYLDAIGTYVRID